MTGLFIAKQYAKDQSFLAKSTALFPESEKLFKSGKISHVIGRQSESTGEQFFICCEEFLEGSAHFFGRKVESAGTACHTVSGLDKSRVAARLM